MSSMPGFSVFHQLQQQAFLLFAKFHPSDFIELVASANDENKVPVEDLFDLTDPGVLEQQGVRLFWSEWQQLEDIRQRIIPQTQHSDDDDCLISFTDYDNSDVEDDVEENDDETKEISSLIIKITEHPTMIDSAESTPQTTQMGPEQLKYMEAKFNNLRRVRQTLSMDFPSDIDEIFGESDGGSDSELTTMYFEDDDVRRYSAWSCEGFNRQYTSTLLMVDEDTMLHEPFETDKSQRRQRWWVQARQNSSTAACELENLEQLVRSKKKGQLDVYLAVGVLILGGIQLDGIEEFLQHHDEGLDVDVTALANDLANCAKKHAAEETGLIAKLKKRGESMLGGLKFYVGLTTNEWCSLLFVVAMVSKEKFGLNRFRVQRWVKKSLKTFCTSQDEKQMDRRVDRIWMSYCTNKWRGYQYN